MEYVDYDKHMSEPVDGFILQGPVSDRQSLDYLIAAFPDDDMSGFIEHARKMAAEGRENDCVPMALVPKIFAGTPFSAYRILSLAEKGQVQPTRKLWFLNIVCLRCTKAQDFFFAKTLSKQRRR